MPKETETDKIQNSSLTSVKQSLTMSKEKNDFN